MDVLEKEQIDGNAIASHWYYEAKYQLIKKHIAQLDLEPSTFSCVDVGAGLGIFLHKMELNNLASCQRSIGVDPACTSIQKAFSSEIQIHPHFPEGSLFDLMIMMDVLEHVEDDFQVLTHSLSHLRDYGYLLITVPAIPLLWSAHDRFLGHYRRYTLDSLEKLIQKSGNLKLLRSHYYFAGILPVVVPYRLMRTLVQTPTTSDMGTLPKFLNRWLDYFCRLELKVTHSNRTCGLTAVAVCQLIP